MNWERDRLEEMIDFEIFLDDLFEELTTQEQAFLILADLGFSRGWIARHFEISKTRVNEVFQEIRKKIEYIKIIYYFREKHS